jgi:RNA polymerase sigma-70 factor (sigma-E family)
MSVRDPRDVAAFTDFAAAHAGGLFRTAYLVVGDHQLAEDLVQEALVKTYVAWPRIRDHGKATAYARKAVVTTAISWSRRRSFHERPQEALPDPPAADPVDGIGVRDGLWHEIASLPPRQRAAIVLRYYEDLSESRTAEVMGCSVGTVKSQVSTGLARLRRQAGRDVVSLEADGRTVTP